MPFNYKNPRNGVRPQFLGYMRVSKDDDLTGSHTFQTQEMRIREHLDRACEAGAYDLELFKDDGLSGDYGFRKTARQRKIRPALKAMVEQIETGSYDAVIVYAQSRLYRNTRGLLDLVEDVLIPNATALLSTTESIDISTKDGVTSLKIRSSVEDMQRGSIVSRNLDAVATTRQLGYYSGQVSYGWDWVPGQRHQRPLIAPIEEHRKILMWMRERYLAGWGAIKIAGDLNRSGVPTALASPRWQKKQSALPDVRWTGSEVYRILSCPTHAGLLQDPDLLEAAEKRLLEAKQPLPPYLKSWKRRSSRRYSNQVEFEHNKPPIQLTLRDLQMAGWALEAVETPTGNQGAHEEMSESVLTSELARWQRLAEMGYRYGRHFEHRLWEPEDFEAILLAHDDRMKKFVTVTARSDNPHLLAGLLRCARCGKRLYARGASAKGYLTYNCDNGKSADQSTCPGLSVRGEYVEAEVVKELERLSSMPALRELIRRETAALQTKEKGKVPDEAKGWRAQLEKFDKRQARFEEMYADGDLTKERYRENIAKVEAERAPIEAKLRQHEANLQSQEQLESRAEMLADSLEHFAQDWGNLDFDERKQVLSLVLENLKADRDGRDIKLHIKITLLPEREITIPYRTNQGKSRSHSHPLLLISNTELAYLHLVNERMSEADIIKHWNLRPSGVRSYAKRIRKRFRDAALHEATLSESPLPPSSQNLPSLATLAELSIEEIAELAKARIEETWDYLKVGPKTKSTTEAVGGRVVDGETVPFVSGVLMEAFVLFASGASTGDVAERLGLSHIGAQGRRSKILKLMGTSKMLEAVEKARRWGILKDNS